MFLLANISWLEEGPLPYIVGRLYFKIGTWSGISLYYSAFFRSDLSCLCFRHFLWQFISDQSKLLRN